MLTFRGGMSGGRFAALAVSVVLAMAVPATSAFAEDHDKPASKPTLKPAQKKPAAPVANSAACQAAIAPMQRHATQDLTADHAERPAARADSEAPDAQ